MLKVLFFFPEGNLPYSPSTLGLAKSLKELGNEVYFLVGYKTKELDLLEFNYQHISFSPSLFDKFLFYYKKNSFYRRKYNFFKLLNMNEFLCYLSLKRVINFYKPDKVVSVDLLSAFLLEKAYQGDKYLLSLEISNLKFADKIDFKIFKGIFCQTIKRFNYLTKNQCSGNYFFLPNSTPFRQISIPARNPNNLIYAGFATVGFGILSCIDFILSSKIYTLTIKGKLTDEVRNICLTIYSELIEKSRIIIDETYSTEDEFNSYLLPFYIGFCFYDLRYDYINNYNYISAPSGKLHKYLAAGIPVIGSNIEGLQLIEDFQCGILIDRLDNESIESAISKIHKNYDFYSINALNAAKTFDFSFHCNKASLLIINE